MTDNTQQLSNIEAARDRFFQRCVELGEQEGQGANTAGQFALEVFQQAFEGILGLDTKRGSKDDDAVKVFDRRMEGLHAKSLFPMKDRSRAVRYAQTRSLIRLGNWPHGGSEEPLNTVQNVFVPLWEQEAKNNRKACFDMVESLVRYARKQVNLQQLVTSKDELRSFILKPAPAHRTLVDFLQAKADELTNLIKGKAGKNTLMDNDDLIVEARDAILERVASLTGVTEPPDGDGPDYETEVEADANLSGVGQSDGGKDQHA